jgi:DNA-binding transcriptional regulator LsrR (DeoR family)
MPRKSSLDQKALEKAIERYLDGGFTQAQLAEELDISQSYFNRLLKQRGLTTPRASEAA